MPGGLGYADIANKLVPTLVTPTLVGGARVGRCHGLLEELALPVRPHHPGKGHTLPSAVSGLTPDVALKNRKLARAKNADKLGGAQLPGFSTGSA